MINLINGASPTGHAPAQVGRRSGDEGMRGFTMDPAQKSKAESFKKVLKDGERAQEPKSDIRDAPHKVENKPDEGPPRSDRSEREKTREVDKAETSSSRKKSQGSKEQKFQEFMASFESETGIPSARLAEALAQVASQEEGKKSPEETADLVLAQLGLSDEKENRARELYMGFLNDTQIQDRSGSVVLADLEQMKLSEKPHMLERFEQSQQRKMDLNKSLDQLNQKFWMTQGNSNLQDQKIESANSIGIQTFEKNSSSGAFQAPLDAQIEKQILEMGIDPLTLTDQEWASLKLAITQEIQSGEAGTAASEPQSEFALELENIQNPEDLAVLQSMLQTELDQLSQELKNEKGIVTGRSPQSTEEAVAALLAQMKAEQKPGQDKLQKEGGVSEGQLPSDATIAVLPQQASAQKGDSFESYLNQGQKRGISPKAGIAEGFESALSTTPDPTAAAAGLSGRSLGEGVIEGSRGAEGALQTQGMAKESPQANEAAMKSIIQQAQYLVKKGGGEMNVKMTPEGLGEVHLKVAMSDGKVNVQLATETAEAKKLFETNIADLKNQLSAQKLSMESVKVDVVQGTNTDQNVRSDNNNQNFANQQQTRQFWNQFQESFGNRSQRDGYLDFSNTRRAGDKEKDPLQPVESKGRVSARSFENKGRGLNLVA